MLIKTKNLKKSYATGKIENYTLDGINLNIHQGEFVAIMGPAGCGKSTLFNILGLLDHPNEGEYHFMDNNISKLAERETSRIRKCNIGLFSHNYNLIGELTVFENIELPLLQMKEPPAVRKLKIKEVMEKMNIMHRRDCFPGLLSEVQQQRVALARAIVIEPKLILADEPTRNLDYANGDEIMKLLTQLNEEGIAIVMMTRSVFDANYAHRIIHLIDGKIIAENFTEQFQM